MDREQFWQLIEQSRPAGARSAEHVARLIDLLTTLEPADIAAFERHRIELMHESYRADLWNVLYIFEGGCGHDDFDEFRYWLILKGREAFETVLDRPESLTEFDPQTCELANRNFSSVAWTAYERKTGQADMPYAGPRGPGRLKGRLLDQDGMKERWPELWNRFMGGGV